MGKIISIVNRKGGVGKTTLTLGLADTLIAEKPFKAANPVVLVVDLDPQGSLTRALLYDRKEGATQKNLRDVFEKGQTFSEILKDRVDGRNRPWNEFLRHGVGPVGKHYSMLANNANAWNVERDAIKLVGESITKNAVSNILKDLASDFSYVLVDAPPGQTVVAEGAIQASDLVLCPTSPDYLSYWGLESFDDYLKDICADGKGPPARFVFTKFKKKVPRYDPQDKVHDLVYAFKAPDRYVTLLREAGEKSNGPDPSVSMPFDPKLVTRLEGAPTASRQWPWAKMYTPDTQRALLRLVSAIKGELERGEPHQPHSDARAANRTNGNRAGRSAQIAG